ncbi:MAG: carboxypeptidase regulatory-like domain-containing protein, partial [Caldilineae bacterium]
FPHTPPGVYSLFISRAGAQAHWERLGLDGRNPLEVDCPLPLSDDKSQTKSGGALEGVAPHAAGRAAVLFTEDGPAWVHRVDEAGRFRFPHTPPGVYTLIVGDVLRRGLVVRPGETLTVRLLEDPAQPG